MDSRVLFLEEISEAYENGHVDFLVGLAIHVQEEDGKKLSDDEIQRLRVDIYNELEDYHAARKMEI